MSDKEHLKVISLFSGAGGMDIGFTRAGFDISVAVEADSACCETLAVNNPGLAIINEKIQDVPTDRIMETAGMAPLEAALVIGGPPCQSFSLAGKRKGTADERGQMIFEFARVVREALPVAFVLENVKGLINWNKGQAVQELMQLLQEPVVYKGKTYRYKVAEPQVLDAADYGVPQHRERLFLVGNRIGADFEYPAPTVESPATVEEAIGGLPPAEEPSSTAKRVAGAIAKRREAHGF